MAKLHELTNGFMESFLRNNPKSLVDSNGYTRSQYEGELAQRAAIAAQPPIEPPAFLPDHRPQFQCTMPDPAAFDTPEEQLGVENIKSYDKPLVLDAPLMVQLIADETAPLAEKLAVIVPTEDAGLPAGGDFLNLSDFIVPLVLTTTPAPPLAEGQPRLRIVDDPCAQCDQQTEARNDEAPVQLADITPELSRFIHSEIDKGWEAPVIEGCAVRPVETPAEGEPSDGADEHNDHE